MPVRLISSVRGIGVAVRVSTSTSAWSALIGSLWPTPKRCSSSTTSSPRFLNFRSWASSRWVPMTTSTSPDSQALDDLLGLGGGEEAAEHLDPDRIAGEAFAEGREVLLGEQRGGHQHRDLLAVLHGLERGPDGDLGLAEADVAADQAVHRGLVLHVGLHVDDGLGLVGGGLVGERLLHLPLPGRVGGEGVPGACGPASGRARPAPGRSR